MRNEQEVENMELFGSSIDNTINNKTNEKDCRRVIEPENNPDYEDVDDLDNYLIEEDMQECNEDNNRERIYYGEDEYNNRIYYEEGPNNERTYYDEYNDPVFYDDNGNRRRPTLKEGFDAYRKDIRDASAPFKTDKNLQKGCWGYGLLALFIFIAAIAS